MSGEVVRAAIMRHFAADADSSRGILATATDLEGNVSLRDDPVGSVYWLPLYAMLSRDDSTYRRTVRRVDRGDVTERGESLAGTCARLVGPDGPAVLDWLRRADLDRGVAAELIDEKGMALANGGDAALSGLVAYAAWYAVSVLGISPG